MRDVAGAGSASRNIRRSFRTMSTKRMATLATLLIVVGFSTWFLAVPMIRFSGARKKYVVGMSFEEARKIAKLPFETDFAIPYQVSPDWKPGEMPEWAKQTIAVGVMYCPKECVVLGFNSYSNLVEIQPVNDPIDFSLWRRARK